MILDDRHCPLRAFDRIIQINLAGTFRCIAKPAVPFPGRSGRPREFASLALPMIETGCFSDEHVRLDGTIRMAPV